jgi:hypothetical protein
MWGDGEQPDAAENATVRPVKGGGARADSSDGKSDRRGRKTARVDRHVDERHQISLSKAAARPV